MDAAINHLQTVFNDYQRQHKQQIDSMQSFIDMYKRNWHNEAKRAVSYGKKLDANNIKRPDYKVAKQDDTDIIIQVLISYEDLQSISWELNNSDYWADLAEVQENETMQGLITPAQFEALKTGQIDYIVFREEN